MRPPPTIVGSGHWRRAGVSLRCHSDSSVPASHFPFPSPFWRNPRLERMGPMRRDISAFRIARAAALMLCVVGAWLSLGASGAFGQDEPAGPRPPAGYFPREDLVVFAEFDGLDAHAEAWKKTAAYRL